MPFNTTIPWKVLTIERTEKKKDVLYRYLLILIGEVLGTFGLVFFGCSSLSLQYGSVLPLFTATFFFGIVVVLMLQIFYPISGGHINPMVSISVFILGHISLPMLFWYMICQVTGAFLGYTLMIALLPNVAPPRNSPAPMILWNQSNYASIKHGAYCCTYPQLDVSLTQAFFVEYVSSVFLTLIVCSMLDPRNADKQDSMPIKVGLLIFIIAYLAAPYSGASFNSARTLGPALYTSCFKDLWIYLLAPNLSSFITTLLYVMFLWPVPIEKGGATEE